MKHALRTWWELELEHKGAAHRILVIETDLETDPEASGFDSSEIDDLIDAAYAKHPNVISRVRVVPKR